MDFIFYSLVGQTPCWVLNFQFEIVGEKNPQPGSLIVSNHIGTPDIFILGACFKGFFVSKAEISDWPFFNLLAWLGMTILPTENISDR